MTQHHKTGPASILGLTPGVPAHTQPIGAVALDGAGAMAVGSYDGGVSIWDRRGDCMIRRSRRQVHAKGVNAVAFSPSGALVASGGSDGRAVIASVMGGAPPVVVEHPVDVECLVFSPDGSRLFTGATNGEGRIWRCSDGALLGTLVHGKTVGAAANLKGMLATGCNDRQVRFFTWDGEPIASYTIANQPIKSLAPARGGLAVGSHDGLVRWIDCQGKNIVTLAQFPTTPKAMASLNDEFLCVGSYDQTISIFHVRPEGAGVRARVACSWRHPSAWAHALAARGGLLAIGSFHGAPAVWGVQPGGDDQVTVAPLDTGDAPSVGISALAVFPNGRLVVGGDEGEIVEIEFPQAHEAGPIVPRPLRRVCSLGAGITDIKAFGDDIIACTWDGRIERFKFGGERLWRAQWPSGDGAGVSPVLKIDADGASGQLLAGLYTGGAAFFCPETGSHLGDVTEATGAVKSVGVRGDVFAITGRYDPIRIGSAGDQEIKARMALETPVSDFVTICPWTAPGDPTRIGVVAKDNEVWIIDVTRGEGGFTQTLVHKGSASRLPVKALVFTSPDSVLAGDYEGRIVRHRVGHDSVVALEVPCRLGISALAVTPRGVVWASFDGTIGLIPSLSGITG